MIDTIHSSIQHCRVCKSGGLTPIHNFGVVPLADKLTASADENVASAPLNLLWCPNCSHLQIAENVSPELLFKDDYPYYSSRIPEVVEHFQSTYKAILEKFLPKQGDLVLEIASNDGVLLQHFLEHTDNVLGIEPSTDHADYCNEQGLFSLHEFFTSDLTKRILSEYGRPKLIMANNVLAHVPDPFDFAHALDLLLGEEGLIVIEVPHTLNLLKNKGFDVIFHQHYSYFSLHSLIKVVESNNLYINDIDKINTQGGSFRLYISRHAGRHDRVDRILKEEQDAGLGELITYREFSDAIIQSKDDLLSTLNQLKSEGKKLAGYGAPGKAATLLNYFGIDHTLLDFLVDISDTKQDKFFPTTGLKIHSPQKLESDLPDYLLILAWNYADSIMKSLDHLKAKGMKFIIPYPSVRIV